MPNPVASSDRATESIIPFHAAAAVVGVLMVATSLLLTSTASAGIVPGRSIAGVKVGDSKAQVRKVLGKPSSVKRYGGSAAIWRYRGPLRGYLLLDKPHGVALITTRSRKQRTRTGVGPGVSYAKTIKKYPKARCSGGTSGPKSRTCRLITKFRGRRVATYFIFKAKKSPMSEVDLEAQ